MIAITRNIHLVWSKPSKHFTLGFHNEIIRVVWVNQPEDDFAEEDVELKYKLTIGLLLFNLEIIY